MKKPFFKVPPVFPADQNELTRDNFIFKTSRQVLERHLKPSGHGVLRQGHVFSETLASLPAAPLVQSSENLFSDASHQENTKQIFLRMFFKDMSTPQDERGFSAAKIRAGDFCEARGLACALMTP